MGDPLASVSRRRGGVGRPVEVDNATAVMRQHHDDVKRLEPDHRHGEEGRRVHGFYVILQEGAPGLRGRVVLPHHALAQSGLTDVDTESEQFAMNPGSDPRADFPGSSCEHHTELVSQGEVFQLESGAGFECRGGCFTQRTEHAQGQIEGERG